MNPQVTVLLSVYNGMPYLPKAISSILNQTYDKLELLVIEDGSTDESLTYLQSINDHRLRLEINSENLGMAASLTKGLLLARGAYIARLDADDIALPNRIETQFDFMEKNKEVKLCGSFAQVISENEDKLFVWRQAMTPLEIKWRILFKNPFIHSSVMFRKETVLRNSIRYKDMSGTEDYQLWSEILKYGQGVNLDQVLIQYRRHDKSMTVYNIQPMREAHIAVANSNQINLLNKTVPFEYSRRLLEELKGSKASFRSANLFFDLLNAFIKSCPDNMESRVFLKKQQSKLKSLISNKFLKLFFLVRMYLFLNVRQFK
ncbi:MAG: glycosyltransferase [Cyclobacteriaceae bacterium]|nr:glycosyltransferase [Cyclobacteriaceae bacterium]